MRQYLHLRIAVTVAFISLLVAVVTSLVSYHFTYANTQQHARESLEQLAKTVSRTANIASYLDNKEIAQDVTYGLSRSELVEAVSLTSVTGLKTSLGSFPEKLSRKDAVRLALESPFSPGEKTGELTILPNRNFIGHRARIEALRSALILTGFIVLVALVITHVVQIMFILPLHQVAESLKAVLPGETLAIATPKSHDCDEIGGLVRYVNHQLELVKDTLDAERQLREVVQVLERRFRMIYERASIGIFLLDQDGRLIMANPSFRRILGGALLEEIESAKGNCLELMFDQAESVVQMLREVALDAGSASGDLLLKTGLQEGERWVHCLLTRVMDDSGEAVLGEAAMTQVIINDITERKRHEQAISFEAEHDPLTHLLNRRAAERKLTDCLGKADSGDFNVVLYMIDLDNFKPINDSFGHEAGDRVLVEVARRLKANLRQGDVIARLGGDEFLVGTSGPYAPEIAALVAEKLLYALNEMIELPDGSTVKIGASIGIAVSGAHSAGLAELLARADHAMYQVKAKGRCGYQIGG